MIEGTGYTIVDWLSAGLAIYTVVISFLTYLYFRVKLEIKGFKEENDGLKNTVVIREKALSELKAGRDNLLKDYAKLKEGHTIHEVRVIGAKPIGVTAKIMLPDSKRYGITEEEFMADIKMQLAQKIGIYCLQNDCIHFEENYDPVRMMKTLSAYLSVASNNEEIVKVLRPNPALAIDVGEVRELSVEHHIQRRD